MSVILNSQYPYVTSVGVFWRQRFFVCFLYEIYRQIRKSMMWSDFLTGRGPGVAKSIMAHPESPPLWILYPWYPFQSKNHFTSSIFEFLGKFPIRISQKTSVVKKRQRVCILLHMDTDYYVLRKYFLHAPSLKNCFKKRESMHLLDMQNVTWHVNLITSSSFTLTIITCIRQ